MPERPFEGTLQEGRRNTTIGKGKDTLQRDSRERRDASDDGRGERKLIIHPYP
jgi:hypothetical protein